MTTATKSYAAIEQRNVTRNYGFSGVEAILEKDGQRLLLVDGFGGQDSPRGGMVRWEHGTASRLLPTDTFETLDSDDPQRFCCSILTAVLHAQDADRPMLPWDGMRIAQIAKHAGL